MSVDMSMVFHTDEEFEDFVKQRNIPVKETQHQVTKEIRKLYLMKVKVYPDGNKFGVWMTKKLAMNYGFNKVLIPDDLKDLKIGGLYNDGKSLDESFSIERFD